MLVDTLLANFEFPVYEDMVFHLRSEFNFIHLVNRHGHSQIALISRLC